MKKRVKEEANSILANCNIKIFGKLEDPTETKDFFDKTVGQALVMESGGFQQAGSSSSASYHDTKQASLQIRPRASYDGLRGFKEGEAVVTFGEAVVDTSIFYSNPGHAKAMRVTRFIALPPPDENLIKSAPAITKLRDLMVHKTWTAEKADVAVETPEEIAAMAKTFRDGRKKKMNVLESGMAAVVAIHALNNEIVIDEGTTSSSTTSSSGGSKAPAAPQKPPLTAQKPGAIDKPVSPLKPPPATTATPEQKTTDAAPAEKADNSNPMSFFSTKKNDEAPAAPAEPEQKPETPRQEETQPSSTTAEPESATPPPAPTPPQEEKPQQQPPKNWQDLVKETSEEDGEESSKDIPEANLDDDSKKELRDAGKNAMDMLLGKKPKDSEDAPKDPPKETKDNKDDDKNS